MKKILSTFSLFFLFASVVLAAPRSLSQMKAEAESALGTNAVGATRGSSTQLEVMKKGAQYTVLGYATGGFAVIANDDAFEAVLGYSDTKFQNGDIPPALQWWMNAADEAMAKRLESGRAYTGVPKPRNSSYPETVDELMLSRWDQSEPYNRVVNSKLNATGVFTGCVATAMAQIMYYHKSPTKATGGHNYTVKSNDPATNGKQLREIFQRTTYDWENMLPVYIQNQYDDIQANAVATLMYHCGVAVEMSYGTNNIGGNGGSGAYDNDVVPAMKQYFGYSSKLYSRAIYTTEQWMDIIYDEISNKRPIFYGGITGDAQPIGHAFVFDGYNEKGLVHVNWGWSGSGNGYYDVALLDSPTGSFSYEQDMVIMHPGGQPEIPYTSQFGLPDFPLRNLKGKFTVIPMGTQISYSAPFIMQMDAENFIGNIGFIAEPVDGGAKTVLDNIDISTQAIEYYQSFSLSNTVSIAGLTDGTYRVYLASKALSETDWQPVRSNETIVNNYILTISNGTATVNEGEPGWTTGIENVSADAAAGDGTVRVYTADGVLVYTAPADGFSMDDVPAKGLLIVKNGAKTVKVMK